MNATPATFLPEGHASYAAPSEKAQSNSFQRSMAHFGKKYGIIPVHRSLPFQDLAIHCETLKSISTVPGKVGSHSHAESRSHIRSR